jgi:ankyrin repeat protein
MATSVLRVLANVLNAADNRTQLHSAAQQGNIQAIVRLLRCGANVEAQTRSKGQTPLHLAAAAGHVDLLPLLINRTTLDQQDTSGRTPLQLAASKRQWEAVAVLMAAGASPCASDFASSPLAPAITAVAVPGRTWGYSVPAHPTTAVLEVLVNDLWSAGLVAEAVAYISLQQQTALHFAALGGSQQLVAKLVEAGADKDAVDSGGFTPLWLAAHMGHLHLVPLLATPTNINMQPDALQAAAARGNEGMVEALLAAGADVEAPATCGHSPLCMAMYNRHLGVVDLLLSALSKQWGQPSKRTKGVAHVAAVVAMLAKQLEYAPLCAQLLQVVLNVLGPEVAGEVCQAVQQQLRGQWEQRQASLLARLHAATAHKPQVSYLAEALLLGWLAAEERLHITWQPLVARLQRLVPVAKTSHHQQQQQHQQQQLSRHGATRQRIRLLARAELAAAAAGQRQQVLELLGQFLSLHLQQPGESNSPALLLSQGLATAARTRAKTLRTATGAGAINPGANVLLQRESSFRPLGVYITFLAAWVGARGRLQQVHKRAADAVVAAVEAARQPQQP